MSLAKIESLLGERAVTIDEDAENSWDIRRNYAMTRVQAATREVFATASVACEAADELAAAVLGLGYRMVHHCQIGAVRLDEEPAVEWRGRIDLVLHPTAEAERM